MPYFLFHVETIDGTAEDHEGAWFPDILSAEKEAAAAVRELVADSVKTGLDRLLPKAIVIAELSGNTVATVLLINDVLPRALRR
jgi:hypothetical protein